MLEARKSFAVNIRREDIDRRIKEKRGRAMKDINSSICSKDEMTLGDENLSVSTTSEDHVSD